MFHRTVTGILLLTLISLLPLMMAQAADGSTPAHDPGKFWAKGNGYLNLHGKGKVELGGITLEMALISNVSQTKIKIEGEATVIPLPGKDAILVLNLKGKVMLKGNHLKFEVLGGQVAVKATGKGIVRLRGLGKFKIGDKPIHFWPVKKVKTFLY